MYERGTFFVKNGIYKGKGLDLGAESPRVNICKVPPWGFRGNFLRAVIEFGGDASGSDRNTTNHYYY